MLNQPVMPSQPVLPIDYTNLGYDSLRQAMLALARASLPEWTDFSESDLGVLLVELFAYACDITLYYQTRIAGNLFPATSDEPDALVQLLRLIGYELHPPTPATTELRVAFNASDITPNASIDIPALTQFSVSLSTGAQLTYETVRDLQILPKQLTPKPLDPAGLQYFSPVPVVQGQTINPSTPGGGPSGEPVAASDGSPNQMYTLQNAPVIDGSISVTVIEANGNQTYWQEVKTLANSGPADRHFVVQRDATGTATLLFGDGNNGLIPPPANAPGTPTNIYATYRVGGGPQGNVPANTPFIPLTTATIGTPPTPLTIVQAVNIQAAAGGNSSEDINRARSFAPHLFRTQERAVTQQDYIDLALQVPGVGKALAVAVNWNQVVLYIAPTGQVAPPSELLVRDILAFFESWRMVSTSIKVVGPQPADIYLGANIYAQPYYLQSDVIAAVQQAVANYLDFDAVNFGQPIYLSKVYDAIQNLPQVASVFIYKFNNTPNPLATPTSPDVAATGIITLNPFELPRPGYRDNRSTPPPNLQSPSPIDIIIQGGVQR